MLTTNVKKYELNASDEQALITVRNIIHELSDEEFFEEEPFEYYSADEFICLLTEILDNDNCAIG